MWTALALLVLAVAESDPEPADEGVALFQVGSSFTPPPVSAGPPKETEAGRLAHAVIGLLFAAITAVVIAQVSAAQQAGAEAERVLEAKRSLHAAACTNDLNALRDHGVRGDVDVRDHYDRTPLHLAALHGNNQAVGLLLHLGASPDARDFDDQTPLLLAARAGHAAAVRTLLDAGATAPVADTQIPAVLAAELIARVVAGR